MYAFEALSCLLETLNYKNFGKTIFFLQDVRKSKSKIAFLCLKSNFSKCSNFLNQITTRSILKTPISESESGHYSNHFYISC